MSERGSPRASYTGAYKLRVVSYAVDHGNRAAGKKFAVDESCVRRWRAQRETLLKMPRHKPGSGRGGPDPAFPLLFEENPASRPFFIALPNTVFSFPKIR